MAKIAILLIKFYQNLFQSIYLLEEIADFIQRVPNTL